MGSRTLLLKRLGRQITLIGLGLLLVNGSEAISKSSEPEPSQPNPFLTDGPVLVPELPHPEIGNGGFYVNAEGDSVYRSAASGDWTIKDCFSRIRELDDWFPTEWISPWVPGEAIAAFCNDSLSRALIDVPTRGYDENAVAKLRAVSMLDVNRLSIEYRLKVERLGSDGLSSKNQEVREAAAAISAKFQPASQPTPKSKQKKENPPKQFSEAKVLDILKHDSKLNQLEDPYSTSVLYGLECSGQVADRLNSIPIKDAIIGFPIEDPQCGEAKIHALGRLQRMPGVKKFIIDKMRNGSGREQETAVDVLAYYGAAWSLIEPSVKKYEWYDIIGKNKITDARYLLDSAVQSSDWKGKIDAANALKTFGDSVTICRITEDMLNNMPVVPSDTTQRNLRALELALIVAERQHMTQCAKGIYRFADSDHPYGNVALSVLMKFDSVDHSVEAHDMLVELAKNPKQSGMRKRLAEYFKK